MAQARALRRLAFVSGVVALAALSRPARAQIVIPDPPPQFAPGSCGGVALFGVVASVPVQVTAFDVTPSDAVTIEAGDAPAWVTISSIPGNPATATLTGAPTITDFLFQYFTPLQSIELAAFDAVGNGSACTIVPLVTLL